MSCDLPYNAAIDWQVAIDVLSTPGLEISTEMTKPDPRRNVCNVKICRNKSDP